MPCPFILQIKSVAFSLSQRGRVVLPLNPARVGYQLVFALRLNATIALGRADHRVWQRPIPASGSAHKNTRLERGSRYNYSSPQFRDTEGALKRRDLSSHVMETSTKTLEISYITDYNYHRCCLSCGEGEKKHFKLHTCAVFPAGRSFYMCCRPRGGTDTGVRCRLPWSPRPRAASWERCPVRRRPRAWMEQRHSLESNSCN